MIDRMYHFYQGNESFQRLHHLLFEPVQTGQSVISVEVSKTNRSYQRDKRIYIYIYTFYELPSTYTSLLGSNA